MAACDPITPYHLFLEKCLSQEKGIHTICPAATDLGSILCSLPSFPHDQPSPPPPAFLDKVLPKCPLASLSDPHTQQNQDTVNSLWGPQIHPRPAGLGTVPQASPRIPAPSLTMFTAVIIFGFHPAACRRLTEQCGTQGMSEPAGRSPEGSWQGCEGSTGHIFNRC